MLIIIECIIMNINVYMQLKIILFFVILFVVNIIKNILFFLNNEYII